MSEKKEDEASSSTTSGWGKPSGEKKWGSSPAASAPETTEAASEAPPKPAPPAEVAAAPATDAAPSPLPEAKPGWGGTKKAWSTGGRSDDPTTRVVLEPLSPTGVGAGKSFLFLFGFKLSSTMDQNMLAKEQACIDDDIEVLRNAGYKVVVDPQATKKDFLEAVAGEGDGVKGLVPAGIYWSAHGAPDGSVETCDGSLIGPDQFDPKVVSPGLRVLILSACYVGSSSRAWRKQLGGFPLVVGWGRPVTIGRVEEFLTPDDATTTDLDDLIARYLLVDGPLPIEREDAVGVGQSVLASGRSAELAARMPTVLTTLGAKTIEESAFHMLIELGLENGRHHRARVTVIASTRPYSEGEQLFAVEADVGELTEVVDARSLLTSGSVAGLARIALISGAAGTLPRIVVQGFLPLARARDQDLAAVVFEVSEAADTLERQIFGGDYSLEGLEVRHPSTGTTD